MIKPTVGRVVYYRDVAGHGDVPLCAIVAGVVDDKRVNLTIFSENGLYIGGHEMVTLVQEGDAIPEGPYCEWMPFQKGQAAKVDDLSPRVKALEEAMAMLTATPEPSVSGPAPDKKGKK